MKRYIIVIILILLSVNVIAQTTEVRPRMTEPSNTKGCIRIFLAGTIDNGNSEDWQQRLVKHFESEDGKFILYNPRRDNWTGTREELEYQVNWELDHLEMSDIVIMNILGSSKSPITLLEMGIQIRSGKLFVACEPDFYRYDNVRITCAKYGVPLYHSLDELMGDLSSCALSAKGAKKVWKSVKSKSGNE